MTRRNGTKSREKRAHKPSKYKNRKTEIDGIVFDSKAEAQHYVDLREAKVKGEIADFRMQVPLEVIPSWKPPWSKRTIRAMAYVADFIVTYNDGREEIQDVKGGSGYQTREFINKKKTFEYLHKKEIVIVKKPNIR